MSGDSLGYIAAVDIGTTTLRCQIFDQHAMCRGSCFDRIELLDLDQGRVEIDPVRLWESTIRTIKNALRDADVGIKEIRSLGIATQRGTFITWRKDNGLHLHNFITWKDLRASDLIQHVNRSWKMKALRFGSSLVHLISRHVKFALVSNLKFASSHITIRLLWLLQNNPEVQKALAEDNLMFGTIDTWLVYKLTGGSTYVTDITNASATGMYDPFKLCWSFIPTYLGIPINILPKVVDNDNDFGSTVEDIFGISIKIGAVMADQSAAMYGSRCCSKNDLKLTMGTGAFLNLNTGPYIPNAFAGVNPLIAWKSKSELVYMSEVACSDAASLVQWMLSTGWISSPDELNQIVNKAKSSEGVYFVPAFSGLGPPINNESAASGFIGIKPNTRKEHMIRAVLESIVYRIVFAHNLLIRQRSKSSEKCIRVDGGVSKNNFMCQLLADMTGLTVRRIKNEMGTLGVAYFAGQSCGMWRSTDDIIRSENLEDVFNPTENPVVIEQCQINLKNWRRAAERFISWYR